MGVIKGATRSLDYGSYGDHLCLRKCQDLYELRSMFST